MNQILVAIVAEFVLLALYFGSHLAVSRYLQPVQRWRAMKLLFFPLALLAGGTGYVLTSVSLSEGNVPPTAWILFAAFLIIWLIHIGYLTVYAVFDRSVTLRIMIEMMNSPADLTFKEIETKYDPVAAFDRRLEILVESGFLEKRDAAFHLTEKGQRTGALIGFLKGLYRTGQGG